MNILKKALLSAIIILTVFSLFMKTSTTPVYASDRCYQLCIVSGEPTPAQCDNICHSSGGLGSINNPIESLSGGAYSDVTSLPLFISNIIRLITIGAGLFALFNFISAGIVYISAGGDEQKIKQAWNMITFSLYGLVIIAAAFIITAIISYVLFQDTSTILNPTIYGPGSI